MSIRYRCSKRCHCVVVRRLTYLSRRDGCIVFQTTTGAEKTLLRRAGDGYNWLLGTPLPIYSFYKGSRIISKIALSQRRSLASRGGGKEFYGGTWPASNPRRRRRGVRGAKGAEGRHVEGVERMGRGYPLQPTRGSGGAS